MVFLLTSSVSVTGLSETRYSFFTALGADVASEGPFRVGIRGAQDLTCAKVSTDPGGGGIKPNNRVTMYTSSWDSPFCAFMDSKVTIVWRYNDTVFHLMHFTMPMTGKSWKRGPAEDVAGSSDYTIEWKSGVAEITRR